MPAAQAVSAQTIWQLLPAHSIFCLQEFRPLHRTVLVPAYVWMPAAHERAPEQVRLH